MRTLNVIRLCGVLTAASILQPALISAQTKPAAYVYVSMTPTHSSVNEIMGFAAESNGALTPLPGSPYTADVTNMAVNGTYLFGVGAQRNGVYIDSFRLESNGALNTAGQTDIAQFSTNDCGAPGGIVLDHTGQSLYEFEYRGDCSNNDMRSLNVMKASGDLQNMGATEGNSWLTQPVTILSNNTYAYAVSCLGNMYWGVWGFKRGTNGALTDLPNFSRTLPTPKSGDFWCPMQASADPSLHVAMVLQAVNGSSFGSDGGAQIASFTAAGNGNLTTTNTEAEMPVTAVGFPLSSSMAPSGKLLAVGGTKGLQIFHFNGAMPATRYTGVLAGVEIDQMFWDKENHLYAISRTVGKLYVFTITPGGFSQAPGSPHAITAPQNVIVRPLT